MTLPDFFLVGAPKCGTTSLHDWLGQHPDVFMPKIKEPHFFDLDFQPNSIWCVRDSERYERMFAGRNGHKRAGESTTWYLYSEAAAKAIHARVPQARIIAMLRNPVEAMYSLHGHYLYSGQEQITDFREALAAEGERRNGRKLNESVLFGRAMLYSEVYRYPAQIKRYFDVFGRENVKLILFDEFAAEPERVYHESLEFLGLSTSFRPHFDVVNGAKQVSLSLSRFLIKRPKLRKIIHQLVPRNLHHRGYAWMSKLTGRVARPSRIDPALRSELLPAFQDDIGQLEELMGKSLAHWRS